MKHIPRFFVTPVLDSCPQVTLPAEQSHHIAHVLRMREGEKVRIFNAQEGEYEFILQEVHKKGCVVNRGVQIKGPTAVPPVHLCCAPLKPHCMDLIFEKGTELGVTHFHVLDFAYTNGRTFKMERAQQQCLHAAQQCGRLSLPEVMPAESLTQALTTWLPQMAVLVCDLGPDTRPWQGFQPVPGQPIALVVGPEGGLSPAERAQLLALPHAYPVSLGDTILRAETAALAGLAVLRSLGTD